ncbi:gamma-glutamyltranspeptidase/glutathione hydrolase [Rhizomicrobium palustre]|uniref:Glutathione hydrolase proenzyme n=1 Tax=Rhizomicrobium palustre TaxID=189966 RepID=A0A846MY61_9PROT|nr:gamma-glutamyltransferase [Rhizomicrobium palustre]NIK88336.1 gamma-glutamyltranspeptidase/glutathione hydrolase [Rhizomicrobium palustre]
MKRFLPVLFAAFTFYSAAAPQASAEEIAQKHLIAAANPYAAEAGLQMLRKGGSAIDAAIAAQMVLTLVEPESSGIGGGAFMMVYDPKTKKLTSFDGRETAPASASPTMFLDANGQPRNHMDAIPGGLSVGVPGVLAMMELAHKKYGKLPWADLFQPAIALAEKGVPVTKKLANLLKNFPQVANMPDIKRHFGKPDGSFVKAGEVLKNPELAETFRQIAKGGARAFYTGPIAAAIVDKVQHAPVNPGGMTLKDLAKYRPAERDAVCGPYRTYKVCSMAPPSSGGITVLATLGMLERFSPRDLKPNTLSEIHLYAQASKLAFADRNLYIGDPGFVRVPVKGMLDRRYLAARAKLIDETHDMGQAEPGTPPQLHARFAPPVQEEIPATSHMSIVDDQGRVVSMTTTVEFFLGSAMMVKGFVLNNQLTDFSFVPEWNGKKTANAPAAFKRPMSSMSPSIVFNKDGSFLMAIGSPGGPAIIPYVGTTLVAMLDGGLSPKAAVALPHHVMTGGVLQLEKDPGLSALAPQLTAMGYEVKNATSETSGLHIVEKVKGGYIGAADPRREGVVLGD